MSHCISFSSNEFDKRQAGNFAIFYNYSKFIAPLHKRGKRSKNQILLVNSKIAHPLQFLSHISLLKPK
jgi:hypothetical protein